DRVEAGGVDGRLVHARAVQPADLLLDGAGGRLVGAGVGGFHDPALRLQALLAQLVESAPAGAVGGDRVGGDPLAVGIGVEVPAGGNRRVEVADVEDRC